MFGTRKHAKLPLEPIPEWPTTPERKNLAVCGFAVVEASSLFLPVRGRSVSTPMDRDVSLVRDKLRTPRAAAIAGVIFSTLLILIDVLIKSIPANPLGSGTQLIA